MPVGVVLDHPGDPPWFCGPPGLTLTAVGDPVARPTRATGSRFSARTQSSELRRRRFSDIMARVWSKRPSLERTERLENNALGRWEDADC